MVIDCNFLVVEDVVQVKEVLYRDESAWVHHAVPRKERLELGIRQIGLVIGVILHNCEVLLSVVELVNVVFKLPVRESLP